MTFRETFRSHPAAVRVAPFVIFVLITAGQGKFGAASAYWFYLAKTLAGLGMVLATRPLVAEMRWAFSWEAILVGVGIFAMWIGVSGEWTTQSLLWVKIGISHPPKVLVSIWDPQIQFGGYTPAAWFFMAVHVLGMTFVVPPLEEVFYRSFLYRYVARNDFLSVPLNQFLPRPFWITALVFGISHNEWLAGILCGAAFQWLVLRKNRLGDAMTAHAITNFLLGIWVVTRGAWQFW
jgi:CAAX prenyl protease-like protein